MIEDIQKINKLAQEFLEQGIVSSREEAVKKAQEMLKSSDMPENPENDKAKESDKEKTEREENKMENNQQFMALKGMIEQNKTYLKEQLDTFRSAINNIIAEFNKLEKEVESLRLSQGPSLNEIKKETESSEPKEENTEKKDDEKKESHPRVGSHNSEEVSIEKMFYMGKK